MGLCQGTAIASKEQYQAHQRVERILQNVRPQKDIKMLLLGTGDSGKSTIAKQMKILYLNGFTDEERKKWKQIIQMNIVSYIKILYEYRQSFNYEYSLPENLAHESEIHRLISQSSNDSTELTPAVASMIHSLWKDPAIQATWERAAEYQISDSASYFLSRTIDFSKPEYELTNDDVLRTRVKTTGIVEIEFSVDKELFRLVDVGGQRSERKKWIHCFQEVKAILFVVALSEYNLFLEENGSINRMFDSLKLFDDIVNNMWFNKTSIILFLNKQDLFEEKIQKIDLNVCFKDYTDGKDYEKASNYILQQYKQKDRSVDRQIYHHFTCATRTDNIQQVWKAAKDILLKETFAYLF